MSKFQNVRALIKALTLKNDVQIDVEARRIYILSDKIFSKEKKELITNPNKKFDLGIGSWGKIESLINYYGFKLNHISKF